MACHTLRLGPVSHMRDRCAVKGAGGSSRVDRGDDRGDLGQIRRVGRVTGRGAEGAAQAAAHLPDGLVGGEPDRNAFAQALGRRPGAQV